MANGKILHEAPAGGGLVVLLTHHLRQKYRALRFEIERPSVATDRLVVASAPHQGIIVQEAIAYAEGFVAGWKR